MASFRKRGKKWEVRFSYTDINGEYQQTQKAGFNTKRDAQQFATDTAVKAANGELVATHSQLFYEYFWKWYETYKEPQVRDRTKLTYVQAYNNLTKYLPNTFIEDLDRQSYQLFLNKLGATRSKSTVTKMNSLYHASVKDALYDRVITRDFVQGTSPVYDANRTWKIEYLNIAELKRIITHIVETVNPQYTAKYMILTALLTGMRPGEIGGLKWDDINMNFNTIKIQQSWNETIKDFDKLKNPQSYRTIRVDHWLLEILDTLPHEDKLNRVFANNIGTIPTSNGVNTVLRKMLTDLKIERTGFHFHSCRHTHVAYLLSKSIDLYAISKRLGHSDMTVTAKKYAYLIEEFQAQTDTLIVDALDGLNPTTAQNLTNKFKQSSQI